MQGKTTAPGCYLLNVLKGKLIKQCQWTVRSRTCIFGICHFVVNLFQFWHFAQPVFIEVRLFNNKNSSTCSFNFALVCSEILFFLLFLQHQKKANGQGGQFCCFLNSTRTTCRSSVIPRQKRKQFGQTFLEFFNKIIMILMDQNVKGNW